MIKIIHDHQINHVGEILDVKRCVSKVSKYIIIVCTVHKIHNMLSLFVTHKHVAMFLLKCSFFINISPILHSVSLKLKGKSLLCNK